MCALSHHIREKPVWWEKVNDKTIVEKWREEALQQAEDGEYPEWTLTPKMVCLTLCIGTMARTLNPMFSDQVRAGGASRVRGLA